MHAKFKDDTATECRTAFWEIRQKLRCNVHAIKHHLMVDETNNHHCTPTRHSQLTILVAQWTGHRQRLDTTEIFHYANDLVSHMTSSRIRGASLSCLFLTSILSSFQDVVCSRVLKGVGSLSGIASFPGAQPGGESYSLGFMSLSPNHWMLC